MQPDLSSPKLPDPDGFYAALVAAHEGLDDAASALLNARLVMLLANQVGDDAALQACIAAAARPLRTSIPS
ncbi:MAG: DUF2783 domain-containing protein [Comamonadaceae bacterium]|nr:MAG: DUF2783 domain-containing protein [Comamonadaceae bacterium]